MTTDLETLAKELLDIWTNDTWPSSKTAWEGLARHVARLILEARLNESKKGEWCSDATEWYRKERQRIQALEREIEGLK